MDMLNQKLQNQLLPTAAAAADMLVPGLGTAVQFGVRGVLASGIAYDVYKSMTRTMTTTKKKRKGHRNFGRYYIDYGRFANYKMSVNVR